MVKAAIASLVALTMVAGASTPAAARPYWGHGHRHGGDAFGNILLGGVLVGGAVAIASAANKNRAQRPAYEANGNGDLRDAGEDAREVAAMCSSAVENMARGRASTVDSVGRDGDGWRVEGVVEAERGDRHFSCGARDGNVDFVQLDDRLIERR